MKRLVIATLLGCISPVLWAQTPALQAQAHEVTQKQELICIHEDNQKTCSRYSVSGLHTNWPWLNQLIRKQAESEQPVFTAKRLPVPAGFDANKDWEMQREYEIEYTGMYRDLVGISYTGWDYGNGAAHGNPYASHGVYDAKTQQAVNLTDMVVPAKKAALEQLLQQRFGAWLTERYGDEGELIEKVKLTDDVSFNDKGVVFHYGVYALGPYAMGAPDLALTWKQVLPALKPQWQQRFK